MYSKEQIQQKINNINYRLIKLKDSPKNIKAPGVVKKLTRQKRNLEKIILGL